MIRHDRSRFSSVMGFALLLFFAAALNVTLEANKGASPSPAPVQLSVALPTLVGGTYELMFCNASCRKKHPNAAQRMTLVLFDKSLDLNRLAAPERAEVEREYGVVLDRSMPPNACYAHESAVDSGRTSFGDRGFTRWRRAASDSILIDLFHGPDSGYLLRVDVWSDRVAGTGRYWSTSTPSDSDSSIDFVTGRRLGNPELSACLHGRP